jgi:hypothetical protein
MDTIQQQIKASGLSRVKWYSQVYLKSDHWKQTRKKALISSNFTCQGCGYRDMLQVHHLTYDHLGDESIDDLMVLCSDCHGLAHELLREMQKSVDPKIQRRVLRHFLYYAMVPKEERIGKANEKRNRSFNTLPQGVKKMVSKAKKSLKKKKQ